MFFPFSSSGRSTILPFRKKTVEYVEIICIVLAESLYFGIANVANIAIATFPGKLKFLISVEFLREYRVRSRSVFYSGKLVSCDKSPWQENSTLVVSFFFFSSFFFFFESVQIEVKQKARYKTFLDLVSTGCRFSGTRRSRCLGEFDRSRPPISQ